MTVQLFTLLIVLVAVGFGSLVIGFRAARWEMRQAAELGTPVFDRGRLYHVQAADPPPPRKRDRRLLRVIRAPNGTVL